MSDLQGRDFKTTVLMVFKELKDMDKVKETIYEQNGKIQKEKN